MPRTNTILPRYITHSQAKDLYAIDSNAQRFKRWCMQQGIGVVVLPGPRKRLRFNAEQLQQHFKDNEILV